MNKNRKELIKRGYKQLKNDNKLDFLLKLVNVLSRTKLNNVGALKGFPCKHDFNAELSIRQFLTVRALGYSFNKAILYSIGANKPLRYPLPKEWRSALIKQEVQVDRLSCALLWQRYVFLLWVYGVIQGLKSIIYLINSKKILREYVFFYDIEKDSLPTNSKAYNIVNWYLKWKGGVKNIDTIAHSAPNVSDYKYNNLQVFYIDGLPNLEGIQIARYFFLQVYLIFYSLLLIFIKPYSAILLSELLKLLRVNLANDKELAGDYLFHSSGSFYRPIWTYAAENKGSRILFYFYSTNTENFKTEAGYPVQYPRHLMSWSHYLVWDKFQTDFLKRFGHHKSTIEEVGPIWYSSIDSVTDISPNSIAVFDVTPINEDVYVTLGLVSEYHIPKIANQFLGDIYSVLEKNDLIMVHKIKRKNKKAHKEYMQNLKKLKKQPNYIEIDPGLGATQVIKQAKACISMPFTSTALIAKHEGKPSVFYDPSGITQADDRAAHGIPILVSIDELQQWVEGIN
jgi:polysaccharide biosynthesis PFTS motif protein